MLLSITGVEGCTIKEPLLDLTSAGTKDTRAEVFMVAEVTKPSPTNKHSSQPTA